MNNTPIHQASGRGAHKIDGPLPVVPVLAVGARFPGDDRAVGCAERGVRDERSPAVGFDALPALRGADEGTRDAGRGVRRRSFRVRHPDIVALGNSAAPAGDYPADPARPRLRNPTMRRMLFVPAAALFGVLLVAGPAWAHSEFDPDEAGTGKVVQLQLSVENEQADAGTTQVQLFFPEGVAITLVDLPAVAGWTTAVEGGAIGAPVTSVTWSRPTASPDENPLLPLTIGPMPADPVRLQFKALQTYSNGEVERWIEDWPAGAPEPDHPAPVLEVTADGPGVAPAPVTTAAPPVTTTTPRRHPRPERRPSRP